MPAWQLFTSKFFSYLADNANKFMAAFEWILCSGEAEQVSYKHCKAMTMLLKALPLTFDTGLIIALTEIWQEEF